MLFKSFDRIRIINLSHRVDRRRDMERVLAAEGLLGDPRVAFFPAHSYPDSGHFYSAGAKGCFSSHLEVLKAASRANASVLILEDDCDFANDIGLVRLPSEWGIFYGGYLATSHPSDPQVSDIVGAHFMGFSAQTVHRLVPWLEAAWESDDPAPIDGEYVRFRRANPDIKSVFADPQIARQRPSSTDIGKKRFFDRIFGVRHAARAARRVKRKLNSV